MATAASTGSSVRGRVLAASARIRRVKAVDRAAAVLITAGGMFVIVSVMFILLFILGEAAPLFRPATGRALGVFALTPPADEAAVAGSQPPAPGAQATQPARAPADPPALPLAFGIDEYQTYVYELLADGRLAFFRASDGRFVKAFAVPALAGAHVVAASRSVSGDLVAAGTDDGRVALVQVHFVPQYEEQRLADVGFEMRERGVFVADPGKRAVREVDYREQDSWKAVAAVVGDEEIALLLRNEDDGSERRETLRTREGDAIGRVRLGRADTLVAGSRNGNLYYWELQPEVRLAEVVPASSDPITALDFAVGSVSILVGDQAGNVSAWSRVRRSEDESQLALVKAHDFPRQTAAVRALAPSTRDKGFASVADDGSLALRHLTSGRTLINFPATGAPAAGAVITPKNDAILVRRADGQLARYEVHAPHPEVSWRALFGKVFYEGYPQPTYVWQSTGATDDFESKFSLVPLVFGTIKATAYAMLFATPLAILAALYTSQFAHPDIKARIKPAVEVMAALPSVVVGFIAGLWLAGRVEKNVVAVLLLAVVLPAFGTAGVLLWDRLPLALRRRLRPGTEIALIVPLLALGLWAALLAGPSVEGAFFGGDFRNFLQSALGLVYDQRNSIVVGLAMGFAVTPIIFTISEDAFSSVPSHLTAASLALGASRWQTAVRVVLPTASPGIFSAVMVGFGRAVGETMIVLMATGNTPVLDWSIFNGMRTLSANIAVEIPEAPQGGTLYRVLFLAGGILFLMTFAVNTIAEVIRQRLRERYKAI